MTDIDDLDDCPEPWRSEIERLREENERLRKALHLAVEWDGYDSEGVPAVWLAESEAALGTANKTIGDEIREQCETAYNAAKRRGDMKKDKDQPGSYREQMIDAGRGHLLRDDD